MNPACMDFYPRPPRGGRRFLEKSFIGLCLISIHALREEGDGHQAVTIMIAADFYPRPPRGGRQALRLRRTEMARFLSTPSARRATRKHYRPQLQRRISIHALREEGDRQEKAIASLIENFYPRPPRGGRPIDQQAEIDSYLISIHALREEGDRKIRRTQRRLHNFYPRPPRGGRPTTGL